MDLAVSPSMVKRIVKRSIEVKRPVFIWGPPGIGKSDIVADIAYNQLPGNNLLIDLRLALMEPTDLRGYPYRNPETDQMEWSPPVDLPSADLAAKYNLVILFLDELNSAPPSVQAAAYQLVLNRRIGQYVLPDNVVIVAAGNRENDRGVVYKMPAPLANRFRHVGMKVNFDDWLSWAIVNNLHADVQGYLSYFKDDLFDFNPKHASTAWASPRTWTFTSEMLCNPGFDLAEEFEQRAEVAGAIGEGIASKFIEHRRVSARMPKPEEIMSGAVLQLDDSMRSEISANYAMIMATCSELNKLYQSDDERFLPSLNHTLRFSFKSFEPELVVMTLKMLMGEYKIKFRFRKDLDTDLVDTFMNKYSKFIID